MPQRLVLVPVNYMSDECQFKQAIGNDNEKAPVILDFLKPHAIAFIFIYNSYVYIYIYIPYWLFPIGY